MKDVTLRVNGMMCSECASEVQSALERQSGVQRVEVPLSDGEARLSTDDTVDPTDLVAAIHEAGCEVSVEG